MRKLEVLVLILVVSAVLPDIGLAADIYVYERANGSKLITDHPRSEPGYRLVRVYGSETDDSGIVPVARKSRQSYKTSPTKFDPLIQRVSNQVTIDPALIKSVMHAESSFDPRALSSQGASGLMQLMPGTARRYGVTRIFDPQQNVMAGSRYLRDLLVQFNGDMRLALAGYNAGENAVLKYGGIPPYTETRKYVRKVIELYKRYRDLHCDHAPGGAAVISCSNSKSKQSASWSVIQ
ncbi:lytic transglycosylase domain-containing protein [Pseudomonadota bacterium]